MKNRFFCAAAAAGLVFGLQPAAANDLASPARSTWSGCYVGANAGYAGADAEATDMPFIDGPYAGLGISWNDPAYETIGSQDNGLTAGVEAGCDRQFDLGNHAFVIGGVVDFALTDLGATGTSAIVGDTHTQFDMDWAASARLRVGAAASDVLFYATGGVAIANIDARAYDQSSSPTSGLMDISGGGTQTGWVAGGGVEWRFKPGWSLGLEYLHYDFGSVTATGAATFPTEAFPRFENDVTFDTIRIGLKWRM
ncbi:MAG TPA: outer membrane beta-barrel protein [Pararhizobium sp.]|uniref:outer membrane protein n=1 Tax=Pararhizobium sp. TaxID=1977563 RepID=UPI002B7AF39A|nr:outer membrane beta-barrel protein [Pararhizobium sp.]HTO30888.1 outer membrane beta-barrel protein [Pararhizobium sp.]